MLEMGFVEAYMFVLAYLMKAVWFASIIQMWVLFIEHAL